MTLTAGSDILFYRYVNAYLSSFFSLPVTRGNVKKLSHEEVVNQLDQYTVSYDITLGNGSSFNELIRISIKAEVAKYEEAIAWLRDLLYSAEFDEERYAGFLFRQAIRHIDALVGRV